jgi:hypothetical protein
MPRGSSAKREREYNELKSEFKKEGRYKGRETEVAARIVNKQRAQYGETKGEKKKDRQGKSPDRNLPIKDYQHKTVSQVERAIGKLSRSDLKEIEKYEKQHKGRKTLLEAIGEQMHDGNGSGSSKKSKSSSKSSGTKSGSKSRTSAKSSSRSSKSSSRGKAKSDGSSKSGNKSSSRTSSKSKRSSKSSKSSSSDHGGKVTTDHDEIRQWVEERKGKPSAVIRTESDDDPGIIRIDFPGYSGKGSLEEISWEDWFEKFEEKKLAFLHQDETAGGKKSNFNKLISR